MIVYKPVIVEYIQISDCIQTYKPVIIDRLVIVYELVIVESIQASDWIRANEFDLKTVKGGCGSNTVCVQPFHTLVLMCLSLVPYLHPKPLTMATPFSPRARAMAPFSRSPPLFEHVCRVI